MAARDYEDFLQVPYFTQPYCAPILIQALRLRSRYLNSCFQLHTTQEYYDCSLHSPTGMAWQNFACTSTLPSTFLTMKRLALVISSASFEMRLAHNMTHRNYHENPMPDADEKPKAGPTLKTLQSPMDAGIERSICRPTRFIPLATMSKQLKLMEQPTLTPPSQ
jgi:hypothetical protein